MTQLPFEWHQPSDLKRVDEVTLTTQTMGTVVALMARGTRCAILWAGDSRVYRARGGRLEQLTRDHSLASEMEGVTPQSLIERNAGRTISMHVKPFSKKDPNAYLGADELDWPAIMTAAETVGGIEWYIIEYEKEGVPPLESLKANLELFKKLRS